MLCICRYRHLSSTCALWRVGGSHRAVRSAGRNSRTAGRGGLHHLAFACHHLNARRWSRVFDFVFGSGEISRPRYGYLSRYAVASTRRVAASTPTGGSGCGAAGRGRGGAPKSWGSQERGSEERSTCFSHTYHTQKSEPATSGNRAPSPCSRRYPLVCKVRRAPSARNHQSPEELRVPARGYRYVGEGGSSGARVLTSNLRY